MPGYLEEPAQTDTTTAWRQLEALNSINKES